MTDRELLEWAAKAAGMKLLQVPTYNQLDADWWAYSADSKPNTAKPWNPLTDDGDALRLAVRLNIRPVQISSGYCHAYYGEKPLDWYFEECHKTDPYASTRRAIVRAAAEIGKEMK